MIFFLMALFASGACRADETKKDEGKRKEEGRAVKIEHAAAADAKKAWRAVKKTARKVGKKISGPGKKKNGTTERPGERSSRN